MTPAAQAVYYSYTQQYHKSPQDGSKYVPGGNIYPTVAGLHWGIRTAPVDHYPFVGLGDYTDRTENLGNSLISKLRFNVHKSPKICNSS